MEFVRGPSLAGPASSQSPVAITSIACTTGVRCGSTCSWSTVDGCGRSGAALPNGTTLPVHIKVSPGCTVLLGATFLGIMRGTWPAISTHSFRAITIVQAVHAM